MYMKTTLKFHHTNVRMSEIKTQETADIDKHVKWEECPFFVGGITNWFNHSQNQSGDSSEYTCPR